MNTVSVTPPASTLIRPDPLGADALIAGGAGDWITGMRLLLWSASLHSGPVRPDGWLPPQHAVRDGQEKDKPMAHPVPIGIPIKRLRPTQMTVGLREVEQKRRHWREADEAGRSRLLRRHVLPAVIGPKDRTYIVDHHHFARALLEEKADCVAVYILADLSGLPRGEFWTFLDNSAWCHAYDDKGRRRELNAIPKHLSDLADDPYRSLVGDLIRAGGVAKSGRPFAEFLWADFLRHRVDRDLVEDDPAKALAAALALAKGDGAASLPGWCGENGAGL